MSMHLHSGLCLKLLVDNMTYLLIHAIDNMPNSYVAKLHGIEICSTSADDYQQAILGHGLLGHCFGHHSLEHSHGSRTHADVSTCIDMSANSASMEVLSRKMLDFILSYSERSVHLTLPKLRVILTAIGALPLVRNRKNRSDLIAALQQSYHRFCPSSEWNQLFSSCTTKSTDDDCKVSPYFC